MKGSITFAQSLASAPGIPEFMPPAAATYNAKNRENEIYETVRYGYYDKI